MNKFLKVGFSSTLLYQNDRLSVHNKFAQFETQQNFDSFFINFKHS